MGLLVMLAVIWLMISLWVSFELILLKGGMVPFPETKNLGNYFVLAIFIVLNTSFAYTDAHRNHPESIGTYLIPLGIVISVILTFMRLIQYNLMVNEGQNNQVDEERPKVKDKERHSFESYIGNDDIKTTAKMLVSLFRDKGIVIPHIILYGQAGTGKTTLAKTIAYEAGVNFFETVSHNFRNVNDVIDFLTRLEEGDMLFIDEIHGLKTELEEVMYSAMQDSYIVTPDGQQIHLPKFCIVGATTLPDEVTKPLRDRFKYAFEVPLYTDEEISDIIFAYGKGFISKENSMSIALRCFGTPRVAINYFDCIKLYAIYKGSNKINKNHIAETFKQKKIDSLGLGSYHYKALDILGSQKSKSMGIQSLASSVGVSKKFAETMIQNGLFYYKLIEITTKGRTLTEKGIRFIDNGYKLNGRGNEK